MKIKSIFLYGLTIVLLFWAIFLNTPSAQESKPTSLPANPPPPQYDDFGYYKKNGKTSKAWNDLVKNGFEAYDRMDCEKAISFFKEAIKAGSDDPIMLFKLAACSQMTGSLYSALQYYKQAEDGLKVLKAPHRYQSDFYEAYGQALLLSKKIDEAVPYLTKAADLGTPSFSLYYLLGELFAAKQQPQAALDYFNKALSQPLDQASPTQLAKIYGALGKAYLEMKDWEKAIQYLDQALKYTPDDVELQRARYRASEMKRQEQLFKMMDTGFSQPLPPLKPTMPTPTAPPQTTPPPSNTTTPPKM